MLRQRFLGLFALFILTICPAFAESSKPASDSSSAAETTVAAAEPDATVTSDDAVATAAPSVDVEVAATDAAATAAEKPKKAAPVPVSLRVAIDLASQRMTVTENGNTLYTWKISSGTSSHPTPRGSFHPQWKAKMWYSRKYDNAPMPYAVFINGGVAVHGTQHVRSLGYPASHGCIRLTTSNARTFYNLVGKHGNRATKVSVYGTPSYSAPVAARRSKPAPAKKVYSGGFFGSFGYSDQGYQPKRVKKQYRAQDKRKMRIVRGPDGRKYRVVVKPKPSYYNDGYAFSGW